MDYKWYKEAQYGLMIHWGLYTLASGEWKGKRIDMTRLVEDHSYNVGEWLQNRFRIPIAEYEKMAAAFNPVYFDAEEWVKAAKNWGMKYIVITTKHHDGFAMYDTKVSDYSIIKRTPFGRDPIKELADACKKYGLRFGLYYSQALDWHEENGGDYWPVTGDDTRPQCNSWDFPDSSKKDYKIYFKNKVIPQVTELLTNYGEISMIWFDALDRAIPEECSKELYELVKKLQPACLTNTRIGHGFGEVKSFDDNEFPDDSFVEGLYETPATLNNTWGYVAHDQYWKNADEVLRLKNHLNSRGVNYLLNVGPDPLGRIPVPAKDILDEVGKKLK